MRQYWGRLLSLEIRSSDQRQRGFLPNNGAIEGTPPWLPTSTLR